jgi:hypothetical protein
MESLASWVTASSMVSRETGPIADFNLPNTAFMSIGGTDDAWLQGSISDCVVFAFGWDMRMEFIEVARAKMLNFDSFDT